MSKLPFVWKLEKDGVISHIVGSPHGIQIDCRAYVPDLFKYLNEKGCVLVEELKAFGGLDGLAETVAKERGMHLTGLAKRDESNVFFKKYALPLAKEPASVISFKKGDDNEMRKLYLEKQDTLTLSESKIAKTCNPCMVERSLKELKKAPTLIIVDLAHLLIGPTMLKYYDDEGFEITELNKPART